MPKPGLGSGDCVVVVTCDSPPTAEVVDVDPRFSVLTTPLANAFVRLSDPADPVVPNVV